jgi:hypothetical protein
MDGSERRKRPFGLYIIVGLQMLIVILLGMSLAGEESFDPIVRVWVRNPAFYTWLGWVLIAALLLAIWGLLRLKRWGWTFTMMLTGLGLWFTLWNYLNGKTPFVGMAIYVTITFYLNQRDVQSAFVEQPSLGET